MERIDIKVILPPKLKGKMFKNYKLLNNTSAEIQS